MSESTTAEILFEFTAATHSGDESFTVEQGSAMHFVGANGCGKTRLSVQIETSIGEAAHRISAHRALQLNPNVPKITQKQARLGLKLGHPNLQAQIIHRHGHRWKNKEAIHLLNDFDYLLQFLFAEQSNTALGTHKSVRTGTQVPAQPTLLEKLEEIWQFLLPHRQLLISGDTIQVRRPNSHDHYSAEELSDGERAIFYLIGQVLCADPTSLLIIDEPELHVHRSIMASLWDKLEAARSDCSFIFITHDLDFAASRVGQKVVIADFDGQKWKFERVPKNTGFTEELTTRILGSRRPILFVEGDESSLDSAIFRACYPNWTGVHRQSSEEVIHAVVTFRRNPQFSRITCAGIVDADGRNSADASYLGNRGVSVLPVAEIENLLLIPDVLKAIGEHEGYGSDEIDGLTEKVTDGLIDNIRHGNNLEDAVIRHCKRELDSRLKTLDLGPVGSFEELATKFRDATSGIDVSAIGKQRREDIEGAIRSRDLSRLLTLYDNKGIFPIVATHMRSTKSDQFEEWLVRILSNDKAPNIVQAIQKSLPAIPPGAQNITENAP